MGHANKGKEVSICVVDADGAVAAEGKVATEPALILSWIGERIGAVERIVHESGPLSIWLTRELAGLGAPVLCSFCEDMAGYARKGALARRRANKVFQDQKSLI